MHLFSLQNILTGSFQYHVSVTLFRPQRIFYDSSVCTIAPGIVEHNELPCMPDANIQFRATRANKERFDTERA